MLARETQTNLFASFILFQKTFWLHNSQYIISVLICPTVSLTTDSVPHAVESLGLSITKVH